MVSDAFHFISESLDDRFLLGDRIDRIIACEADAVRHEHFQTVLMTRVEERFVIAQRIPIIDAQRVDTHGDEARKIARPHVCIIGSEVVTEGECTLRLTDRHDRVGCAQCMNACELAACLGLLSVCGVTLCAADRFL